MSKYKKLFKNAKFWDQKLAVIFVVPLSKTGITPNQITFITLILAIFAGYLFALGDQNSLNYGAAIFVIARFMDNFDGMIARIKNMETEKLINLETGNCKLKTVKLQNCKTIKR